MGIFGVIGGIIAFPFKLIFGKRKESSELPPEAPQYTQSRTSMPGDAVMDNMRAKMDMMMAQMDSLKLEYEALDQRIQNMERMIREIYMIAKS